MAKMITKTGRLGDIDETPFEDLASEIREVVDNASGTPRENTQRIQTLGDTADTLEGFDSISIPEHLSRLPITWMEWVGRPRKPLSRAKLRDNITSMLSAAIDALNEHADKLEEENPEEHSDEIEEARSLMDDLERIKDEADSVEFPGMFG